MPTSRLAHTFVFANDLDRVAAFDEGALGRRREPSRDEGFGTMRATSGADVAIHAPPKAIAERLCEGTDPEGSVVRRFQLPGSG